MNREEFSMQRTDNKWLQFSKSENPTMRLFCIPYAGGNANYYADWYKQFDSNIEVCAVQLPGHGNRIGEEFITDIKAMVNEIFENIKKYLDKPFAFFGHSMGGVLSYLVSVKVEEETGKTPVVIFESGSAPPDCLEVKEEFQSMSDERFIDKLLEYDAATEEVLKYPEFYEWFLPIIKNDFKLVGDYVFDEYKKLNCPIVLFAGTEDRFNVCRLKDKWGNFTNKEVHMYEYEGSHFFINQHKKDILHIVNETLA